MKKDNLNEGLFNALSNPKVPVGNCALLKDDKLVYFGRIGSAPDVSGHTVHLHPKDFEKLQRTVKKHQH